MCWRGGWFLVLVAALLLCSAAVAVADEQSEIERAQFVKEAEPICQANVKANKRIFQGLRGEVKRDELKRASKHFLRAAPAFGRTIRELAALPQPPADATRLATWFERLKGVKAIVLKVGKAFAAEQKHRASRLGVELNRAANKANNTVIPFGFNYCLLEPARFSG
jgi:hypothetical protein